MAEVRWSVPTGGRFRQQLAVGAVGLTAVLVGGSYVLVGRDAGLGVALPADLASRLVAAALAVGIAGLGVRAASDTASSPVRRAVVGVVGLVLAVLAWVGYLVDGRIRGSMISVLVAVVVSLALFVGANRWFDAVPRGWTRFATITGGVLVGLLAAALVGNRQLGWFVGSGDALRDLSWVLVVVLAGLGAAYGNALSRAPSARSRLVVGVAGGAGVGLVVGLFLRFAVWPAPRVQDLVVWPVVGAAALVAVARLRGRRLVPAAVTGASLGWLLGAWLLADLGAGSAASAVASSVALGAGLGARLGLAEETTLESRLRIEARARVAIFLAPALIFISATLLIPTVQTVLLSLMDRNSDAFVGMRNYATVFADPNFMNVAGWLGIFTAAPFVWASALLTTAVVVAARFRRQVEGTVPARLGLAGAAAGGAFVASLVARNGAGDGAGLLAGVLLATAFVLLALYATANRGNTGLVGGAGTSLAAGVFLLAFAIFANLRGTLFNNLWWVFTVTILSAGVGLAVAALADRSRGENVAKSIIFMPMAISFVGAAIIWRFMYIARPPAGEQTGVLNALWVWLGRVSTSEARFVAAGIVVLAALGLVYAAVRGFRAEASGLAWSSVVGAVAMAWLAYRILGPGIGGFTVTPAGQVQPEPIQFLTVSPYNNFWVMVPFIWIYTGFAMVIFSAAIKSVPSDLLEAARVDGATESQMFWRVTVPQIAPTIGVVITTIMVTVMKVFDIVKVMTNGNFGTQVLANEMWTRAFTQRHFGQGSAIAVVLFLSVLPIMYLNIRRMQKEAV